MRALQLGCSTLTTPQTKKGVTAAYMKQFIGCDAHKKYSVFVAVNERGEASQEVRVGHECPLASKAMCEPAGNRSRY